MVLVYSKTCATYTRTNFRTFSSTQEIIPPPHKQSFLILVTPVPGHHCSAFCLHGFTSLGHFIEMESFNMCPVVSGFFQWDHAFKVQPCCSVCQYFIPFFFFFSISCFFVCVFVCLFVLQVLISHQFYTHQCIHVNPNREGGFLTTGPPEKSLITNRFSTCHEEHMLCYSSWFLIILYFLYFVMD